MTRPNQDQVRITAAIAAAKDRVAADIRLVSVPASSRYGAFALLHSLIAAAISGFVVAVVRPHMTAEFVVTLEFAVALVALACLQIGWFREQLVPKAAYAKAAKRQARLTWAHLKLKAHHDEPLVLLFCSRLERHVEILAEERVLLHVPPAAWEAILAEFRPHMQRKDETAAFVHLVERTSEALLPFFPAAF